MWKSHSLWSLVTRDGDGYIPWRLLQRNYESFRSLTPIRHLHLIRMDSLKLTYVQYLERSWFKSCLILKSNYNPTIKGSRDYLSLRLGYTSSGGSRTWSFFLVYLFTFNLLLLRVFYCCVFLRTIVLHRGRLYCFLWS